MGETGYLLTCSFQRSRCRRRVPRHAIFFLLTFISIGDVARRCCVPNRASPFRGDYLRFVPPARISASRNRYLALLLRAFSAPPPIPPPRCLYANRVFSAFRAVCLRCFRYAWYVPVSCHFQRGLTLLERWLKKRHACLHTRTLPTACLQAFYMHAVCVARAPADTTLAPAAAY